MTSHKLGALFFVFILAIGGLRIAHYYPLLPEKVASHFNAFDEADAWMPKSVSTAFLAGMIVMPPVLAAFFTIFLGRLPDGSINIPKKSYWLAPERRKQTLWSLLSYLYTILVITDILLLGFAELAFLANVGQPEAIRHYPILLIAAYLAILVPWFISFFNRFNVLPEEESECDGDNEKLGEWNLDFAVGSPSITVKETEESAADPREPAGMKTMEYRQLGKTDLKVSAVAMGCWPIAGVTTPNIVESESLATLKACFDLGVNHLDTAYMYGKSGESERLIAKALGSRRDEMVIATKGGLGWDAAGQPVYDCSPATLRRHCEESLQRLQTDRVELYYLHAPDEKTPIADAAGELKRLLDEGKTLAVGASNLTVAQLDEFSRECPLSAVQPPYNMLQRQIEADVLPWCRERDVSVMVFWPLMKGLLAGKMRTDQKFENDNRRNYPQFHGDEWEKNLAFVEKLRAIAKEAEHTVAELVINWTIHRPGVTGALCGARRPEQIAETAGGAGWELSPELLTKIDDALRERGPAAIREA